jgi:hypothetical protein
MRVLLVSSAVGVRPGNRLDVLVILGQSSALGRGVVRAGVRDVGEGNGLLNSQCLVERSRDI